MVITDLMAMTKDAGFQHRVQYALFNEAKDQAGTAVDPSDDLVYLNGILAGEAPMEPVYISVVVVATDPNNDADIAVAITTLWPFLARAWVARTV